MKRFTTGIVLEELEEYFLVEQGPTWLENAEQETMNHDDPRGFSPLAVPPEALLNKVQVPLRPKNLKIQKGQWPSTLGKNFFQTIDEEVGC